jgi:hypothetical protein
VEAGLQTGRDVEEYLVGGIAPEHIQWVPA